MDTPQEKENTQAPVTSGVPTEPALSTDTVPSIVPSEVPVAAPIYKKKPMVIAIVVALILIGAAGYFMYSENYSNGGTAAVVNGKRILTNEYNESIALIEESATAQGVDLTQGTTKADIRTQALDVLINNALLITAAEDAGFTVTDEEIEGKYSELATQLGGEETLNARMTEIGLTEEKLRSNIRERILADAYIESATDIENLTVSEAEIDEFLLGIQTEGVELPPLEEIKPQIEAQILNQKQQQLVVDLLATLREAATIDLRI